MAKSTIDEGVVSCAEVFGRAPTRIPDAAPLTTHGPARVLAVVNQKGGVGKTTTTINLGAALAELGRRVLLVDFDPQGALSVGLGLNVHELETSIYHLMMDPAVTVDDVLLKTDITGMDLIPSQMSLSAAEIGLVNVIARETVLQRSLAPVMGDYDVILIDCQPSLGLLTVNALAAADALLVPLECEYFALRAFGLLLENVTLVRERINPSLEIQGILATMYDARTAHSREVLDRICEAFPDKVFDTVISRTVKFPDSTNSGQSILSFASSSSGASAYRRLARELIAQGGVR